MALVRCLSSRQVRRNQRAQPRQRQVVSASHGRRMHQANFTQSSKNLLDCKEPAATDRPCPRTPRARENGSLGLKIAILPVGVVTETTRWARSGRAP